MTINDVEYILLFIGLISLFFQTDDKRGRIIAAFTTYFLLLLLIVNNYDEIIVFLMMSIIVILTAINSKLSDEYRYENELHFVSSIFYYSKLNLIARYQVVYFAFLIIYYVFSYFVTSSFTTLIVIFAGICLIHIYLITEDKLIFNDFNTTLQKAGISSRNRLYEGLTDDFLDMLIFILYVEDRTFLDRKGPMLSITYVINKLRLKLINYGKFQKRQILKRKNKFTSHNYKQNIERNFRKYFRGYSTLEQQVVRSFALRDWSYQNVFRRKLFIERTYTKYLLKSFKKNRIKLLRRTKESKSNYNDIIDNSTKVIVLLVYYKKIVKNPSDVNHLIQALAKQSRVSNEYLWMQYFDSGYTKFKNKAMDQVIDSIKKYDVLLSSYVFII